MLDAERIRINRVQNFLHSVLLIVAMAGLLGLIGWCLGGLTGLIWTAVGGGIAMLFARRLTSKALLRMYGAVRLQPAQAPVLFEILIELTRRAGLDRAPALWVLPSPTMNAFAIGRREDAAICLSTGLVQRLEVREIAGVMAHEVAHVENNDMGIMGLADTVSRVTTTLSTVGLVFMAIGLPAILLSGGSFPWLLALVLLGAPILMNLLQLALSRTREFHADLEAAELTRDPEGLARALRKLEVYSKGFWEQILLPGRRVPEPSLLRTHPPTDERIERLLSYDLQVTKLPQLQVPLASLLQLAPRPVHAQPRWRVSGLWY